MEGRTIGCGAFTGVVLCRLFAWATLSVAAEDFPTKPVTLVIPVGVGGSHDLTARTLATVAPKYLGQPLIIEVKPGGGGAIGCDYVAKSKPDGYTLVFGGPGWSSTLPAVEGRSQAPDTLAAALRSSGEHEFENQSTTLMGEH